MNKNEKPVLFHTTGNNIATLDRKICSSQYEYDSACNEIQILKCSTNCTGANVLPTLSNISFTVNLPRIEKICKNAKRAYFNTLNRKGRADSFENVQAVYLASNVYLESIKRRSELLRRLTNARSRKKRAAQSIGDLLKLKNK